MLLQKPPHSAQSHPTGRSLDDDDDDDDDGDDDGDDDDDDD